MDRHFLSPNSLDYKLTRAASFSELSTSKKIIFEERFRSETRGNLVKQYSCEQIVDRTSKTSEFKIQSLVKSDNGEHMDTWESKIPGNTHFSNTAWMRNNDTRKLDKSVSFPSEHFVTNTGIEVARSKNILAPPKLLFNKSGLDANKQIDFKEPFPAITYKSKDCQNDDSTLQFNKLSLQPQESSNVTKDLGSSNEENIVNDSTQKNLPIVKKNAKKVDTTELKKNLRPLIPEKFKQKKNMIVWSIVFVALFPLAVLHLGSLITDIIIPICRPQFKFNKLAEELTDRVHGQNTAVYELTNYFTEKDNQNMFDTLILVGGIGVGKSYTTEIINNILKDSVKIIDFFPPLYTKNKEAYLSLSVCRCNIIRLENLKTDDISDTVGFINNLKQQANNYCILVIALFNPEEVDNNLKRTIDLDKFTSMINKEFHKVQLHPRVITYEPMSTLALTKCVIDAAKYINITLSADEIEKVNNDLLLSESGCKQAYSKVQLLVKSANHDSSDL